MAYRAIDRYHDRTFDNIVSGEATRLFVFERASVSAFIAAADALLVAEAPSHALSRLKEVFQRLDADRPDLWEHGPVEARVWLDTALCTLVLLRVGNGELDLAEATQLLAFYRAQHPRLPVPGDLHGDLTEGLAECGPDDYDPFTYALRLPAGPVSVDVRPDARTEFASELERMGRRNLGHIPKQTALIAALDPDIRRGAAFVNIFQGDNAPLLVITSLNVWVVNVGLFGAKARSTIPLHSITEVDVKRRPFRDCLGIHLVLSSDAGAVLDYQFGSSALAAIRTSRTRRGSGEPAGTPRSPPSRSRGSCADAPPRAKSR